MFEAISDSQVAGILAIFLVALGFIGYYFSAKNDKEDTLKRSTSSVLKMRNMGFIWMGLIPFGTILLFTLLSSYSLADFGAALEFPKENIYWCIGFALFLVPMNFFNAKSEENLKIYPQIREAEWSSSLQVKEYTTWFLYLLAYEWLFRGVLFFGCREVMDFLPALAINTVVYSLVHIPKGLKETFWSIPLGVMLCILVERTGVFYGAVIIHFTQAASSSFFSLRAHPNMKIIRK